ncbi:MAG: elongation factor G [Proteobacteria bacterium]|nr:elongation factor G [Pseudomonadota bacterium]
MHKSHGERNIHSIAIVSKDGVGKTKLVESLLSFQTKQQEIELVELPEEKSRGYTLYNKFYHLDQGNESINLIDTPGNTNFVSALNSAVYVSSGAVFVASAIGGSEGALRVWESIFVNKTPRAIFVNQLDLPEANFDEALQSIEASFGIKPAVLFIPWSEDDKLVGVIDIINKKLLRETAGKIEVEDLPEGSQDEVESYRSVTYERLAELDDELMEYYIEEQVAPDELLVKVLSQGIVSCEVTPVLVGSVEENIGIANLFEFIKTNFPTHAKGVEWSGRISKEEESEAAARKPEAAEPFSGVVFKSSFDRYIGKMSYILVVSGILKKGMKLQNSSLGRKLQVGRFYVMHAGKTEEIEEAYPGDIVVLEKVEDLETNQTICEADNPIFYEPIPFLVPKYTNRLELSGSSKDSRIMDSVNKLIFEDPTLTLEFNPDTNEMLLSGMGVLHLDVTREYLKNVYDVEINLVPPQTGYLETIVGKSTVQGKYKKQSGGHGQYGDVHITIEPTPRNGGFEFVDKIVGGAIPKNYIPGVEKGVKESLQKGTQAGYPVVDLKVTLFDGTFHAVDSSDFAFQRAGSMAIKKAMPEAKPVILEPIMEMEIDILESDVGKVSKDLSGRRGKVSSYSYKEFTTVIHAEVPMAELMDYTPTLRGMTVGLGLYSMKLKSYEILASNLAEKVIASRKVAEE